MSAEGGPASAGGSWRVTLPCTRAEAEAIDAGEIDDIVLMTTEEVEDDRERWRLDAYIEAEPDADLIARLRALAPSATGVEPLVRALADEDWVTLSQAGLEPIREGRFVVHTAAHPADAVPGGRTFLIDAGRAFGTGHHATTAGCLAMLDRMADRPVAHAIDIGTGTGLLAFAARELWPDAAVMATDVDVAAVEVAHTNAAVNGVERIDWVVADGALHDTITTRAPFDLVIANVLAGPLVSMAPELAAIAAPGAVLILAGLLDTQAEQVIAAYAACGCSPVETDQRGDWTVLKLAAGATRYVPDRPFDPKGRDGWALDL
ncbi:50S ribosomal protein L11 methyltransferase [Sphingomonas sp.]|jgi:ribosomal protein L11 methyltransferase|uniref:50S ribosomal protein L11 methyltransferase n=1 Tax=Sphingomonas sp. TaxID=28214 RepID=UPI002D80867D|nr:50S ribosomal protein L11 methyltransferase [Sphingomonas sp.]HEU0043153.1 50S ribosomal protein L11 methyltransferase [Sphingomonas sp.]